MNTNIQHNIIITESSSNLRALGRNALQGKWKVAVLAVLVYTLCINVPAAILNGIFGVKVTSVTSNTSYMSADAYNMMPAVSPMSNIYQILVTGSLILGICIFFLAMFRRQQVSVQDIFLGFEKFGKALGLLCFMSLFVILWSLLFIVPGIIASIRYSQAFFILADDPSKGIRQCMDESKMMMVGNKSKYFCLGISFIGWALLSAVPQSILISLGSAVPGIPGTILMMIAPLAMVPVTVYMLSTFSGFYEILAGHLIKDTEPKPIEGHVMDGNGNL